MPKKNEAAITIVSDPSAKAVTRVWKQPQRDKVSGTIGRVADAVMANLQITTPKKSGRLVASQKIVKVNDLESKIVEGVEYGVYLRQGVPAKRINPILPRRKKALFWPTARHPVRAVYNHPGIKKNDYWQSAIDKSQNDVKAEVRRTVVEIEESVDI